MVVWTGNKLGVEGAKALVPALMTMTHMTSLDVGGAFQHTANGRVEVRGVVTPMLCTRGGASRQRSGRGGCRGAGASADEDAAHDELELGGCVLAEQMWMGVREVGCHQCGVCMVVRTGNHVGEQGAKALVPALMKMPYMTSLGVGGASWHVSLCVCKVCVAW